jgi:hypothetical protein
LSVLFHAPLRFAGHRRFEISSKRATGSFTSCSLPWYPAGSTKLGGTIDNDLSEPQSIAFGSNGYLNVADYWSSHGYVDEYAPKGSVPARTLVRGIRRPAYLRFGP